MKNFILAFGLLTCVSPALHFAVASEKSASYDARFLDQFSNHRKEAIRMSEMAISKAENPDVKKNGAKNDCRPE